jgi:hypothetical protein
MNFYPAFSLRYGMASRTVCAVTLGLVLGSLALAQQEQSQPQQQPPSQQQTEQQPQPSQQQQTQQNQQQSQQQPPQSQAQSPDQSQQQAPPPPAQQSDRPPQNQQPPQNPNRPPITSQDRVPPNSPQYGYGQQYPPQYGQQYGQQAPPNAPAGPPPPALTIPKGTVVIMRLNEPLSSDHNQIGDQFTGVLEQPIVVDGWVVGRPGETVIGQVKSVKKAGRVTGVSQLGVELTDITLVDGTQAPVLTELWKASGGTSRGADAATIAGGTGLGAAIGAAADWGRGAAIGAGAGAVVGIGAVLLTRGRPTILAPESQLTFRLVDPVKVDTTHSQQAFQPVSQEDFQGDRPRLREGNGYYGYPYPGYAPAPCGYYYPCYYYPGYVGIYPAFGWGWGWGFYGRGWYGPRGFRRF